MIKQNKIYTKKDILLQLEEMNAPKDSIVLMHSSLRLTARAVQMTHA